MATITSVKKVDNLLEITYSDGVVTRKTIAYENTVLSEAPAGSQKVDLIYLTDSTLIIKYGDTTVEIASGAGDMTKAVYDPAAKEAQVATEAELDTHEGATDPHTGYQKESEREAASGYAGLNSSSKVIKDPANATATPTASKIPIADGSGKLDDWVTAYTDAEAVAAVNAAGILLADTKKIEHDPTPATSHTANGEVVTMTAGIALVFGDACYVGTDGKMEKALADDAAITIPATHLCIATIAENAAGLFLVKGWAHDDSWAFDVGLSVYLSAATAGLITKTMPVKVTGNQVQVLGTCLVADTIFWNPSMVVMEYA